MPSVPLLSSDGSYARLIPHASRNHPAFYVDPHHDQSGIAAGTHEAPRSPSAQDSPEHATSPCTHLPSRGHKVEAPSSLQRCDPDGTIASSSESDSSIYSEDSFSSTCTQASASGRSSRRQLGNVCLDDGAGSDEEVDLVVTSAQYDAGRFPDRPEDAVGHEDFEEEDPGRTAAASEIALGSDGTGAPHMPRKGDPPEDRRRGRSSTAPQHSRDQPSNAPRRPVGARGHTECRRDRQNGSSPDPFPRHRPCRPSVPSQPSMHGHSSESSESEKSTGAEDSADEGATPRLPMGPSSAGLPSVPPEPTGLPSSTGEVLAREDLHQRPSRLLPVPPPRTMCDIPASVSALEALRVTQLCPSRSGAALVTAPVSGLPRDASLSTMPEPGHHRAWLVPGAPVSIGLGLENGQVPRTQSASRLRKRSGTAPETPRKDGPGSHPEEALENMDQLSSSSAHQRRGTILASLPDPVSRPAAQPECSVKQRIAALEGLLKDGVA